MKRSMMWFTVLAALTFGITVWLGYGLRTQAQAPDTPNAVPIAPLPGSATEYRPPTPSPSPSPVLINPPASPTASPTGTPTATPSPTLPLVPIAPPPPPMPMAEPLPTSGEFQDPSGRFRVAILKDYKVTPIAGSVLIESQDGSLAYTALAQPSPSNFIAVDTLAEMAKNTFKQGEGFRPGSPQPIAGGMQMDWSGELTIGGQTQPINGVIIAKPAGAQVLMALIAATEKAAASVPNAAAALTDSLQAMQ